MAGKFNFDITNALNIDNAFNGCSGLTNVVCGRKQGVTSGPGITNAAGTFNMCISLVDIQYFHSEQVTDFTNTFTGTLIVRFGEYTVFTAGTKFIEMAKDCVKLECVSSIDTTSSTDNTDIFKGCIQLISPTPSIAAIIASPSGLDWSPVFAPNCMPGRYDDTLEITASRSTSVHTRFNMLADGDIVVYYPDSTYTVVPANVAYTNDTEGQRLWIKSYHIVTKISFEDSDIEDINFYSNDHLTDLPSCLKSNDGLTRVYTSDSSSMFNIIDATSMMEDCIKLTQSTLMFPSALGLSRLYSNCVSLTQLHDQRLNCLADGSYMFNNCSSLKSIKMNDHSSITPTDALVNVDSMFRDCELLTDAALYKDTSLVDNFSHMYYNTLIDKTDINTPNGVQFDYMYAECPNLLCIGQIDTTTFGANKLNIFENSNNLILPNPVSIIDIEDADGAVWVNSNTCPPVSIFEAMVVLNFDLPHTSNTRATLEIYGDDEVFVSWKNDGVYVKLDSSIQYNKPPYNTGKYNVHMKSFESFSKFQFHGDAVYSVNIAKGETLTSLHTACAWSSNMVSFTATTSPLLLEVRNLVWNCPLLTEFFISDTTEVVDFTQMLAHTGLSTVSVQTPKGQQFTNLFYDMPELVCISGEIDTRSQTVAQDMFRDTPKLINPDASAQIAIETGSLWINTTGCL